MIANLTWLSCGLSAEPSRPNILIIYADDIGRGDLSCWGQDAFSTPNIDRLAEQGMRFDHFYGCTVCAPARASLLTGNTNAHSPIPNAGGLECQLAAGLISQREFDVSVLERRSNRPGRYFLGHMAKSAGYTTAFFGKLGIGYTETAAFLNSYGFDTHVGLYDSVICWSYYPEYYWENGEKVMLTANPKFDRATPHCPMIGEEDMVYSEDVWLDKCLDYIRERAGEEEPFLAIYASQLPHGPVSIAPKDFVFKNHTDWTEKERVYASMMHKLDQSVGKLVHELEEQGLDDNTLVIFMGDNGHEPNSYSNPDPIGILNGFWDGHHRGADRFNGTLGQRGIKRHNFEGGLNVPFIIRWTGKVEPGQRSARRTAVYDILPTLADVLDVEIPVVIDGISFLPTLTGKGVQPEPDYLFWINTSGGTKEAIIVDDWKLIKEIDRERSDAGKKLRVYRSALYHLKEDPYEETDLASGYPEKVEALQKLIAEAMKPLD